MATPRDKADFWDRAWQWGPGFVILMILFLWFRPHVDSLIKAHGTFLVKTTENQEEMIKTQAKQVDLMSTGQLILNRLDTECSRNGEILRDIHNRMLDRGRRAVGDDGPQSIPEIVSSPK